MPRRKLCNYENESLFLSNKEKMKNDISSCDNWRHHPKVSIKKKKKRGERGWSMEKFLEENVVNICFEKFL